MTVKRIKHFANKTEFEIEEPTPYGEPDKQEIITVSHDFRELLKLPGITRAEIDNLPDTREEHKEAEIIVIPNVGTIVFIKDYDTECYSSRYRSGAHDMRGPYLLREYNKYIVRFHEESAGSQCNMDHVVLIASFVVPNEEILRKNNVMPDGHCTNVSAPGCEDCSGSKIVGFKIEPLSKEHEKELDLQDSDIVPEKNDPKYGRVLYYLYLRSK